MRDTFYVGIQYRHTRKLYIYSTCDPLYTLIYTHIIHLRGKYTLYLKYIQYFYYTRCTLVFSILFCLKKKCWSRPSNLILQPTNALQTVVWKTLFLIMFRSPEAEGIGLPSVHRALLSSS